LKRESHPQEAKSPSRNIREGIELNQVGRKSSEKLITISKMDEHSKRNDQGWNREGGPLLDLKCVERFFHEKQLRHNKKITQGATALAKKDQCVVAT